MKKIIDWGLVLLIPGIILVGLMMGLLARMGNDGALNQLQQIAAVIDDDPDTLMKVLKDIGFFTNIIVADVAIIAVVALRIFAAL